MKNDPDLSGSPLEFPGNNPAPDSVTVCFPVGEITVDCDSLSTSVCNPGSCTVSCPKDCTVSSCTAPSACTVSSCQTCTVSASAIFG